jgi:ABC-type Fe3+-hydroxamate transport system substrate-binding protein
VAFGQVDPRKERKSFDECSQPWFKKQMKVVSLVPSWTEMLISSGVDVVGRTRFCIHPQEKVAQIPVVGGTKDLKLEKLAELKADLLILDQEENLPWMKEQSPIAVHVTHVTSVESVAGEIAAMANLLGSAQLKDVAERWRKVAKRKALWNWGHIPGQLKMIDQKSAHFEKLVYVIWKNPWMRVSADTFIGSVLGHLGAGELMVPADKKYPEFRLEDFDLEKTFFLFSSEPYPFHQKFEDLRALRVQGAIVDGESFSWFGLRSLEFLERIYSPAT